MISRQRLTDRAPASLIQDFCVNRCIATAIDHAADPAPRSTERGMGTGSHCASQMRYGGWFPERESVDGFLIRLRTIFRNRIVDIQNRLA